MLVQLVLLVRTEHDHEMSRCRVQVILTTFDGKLADASLRRVWRIAFDAQRSQIESCSHYRVRPGISTILGPESIWRFAPGSDAWSA